MCRTDDFPPYPEHRDDGQCHDECWRQAVEESEAGVTPAEAYGMVAGEMYEPGEYGYQSPATVLDGLDPSIVALAERYARDSHKPWPPRPSGAIAMVTIESWT